MKFGRAVLKSYLLLNVVFHRKPFLNNNGICCFTLRNCRLSSFDRKLDGTWPSFKKEKRHSV